MPKGDGRGPPPGLFQKLRSRQTLNRRMKVAGLRLSGITSHTEMARRLDTTLKCISDDMKWLDEKFKERAAEDIEIAKGIDAARVDKLIRAVWPRALAGDHPSIDRVLRLLERRAKMFGYDAPEKREEKVDVTRGFIEALREFGADEPVTTTYAIVAPSNGAERESDEPFFG